METADALLVVDLQPDFMPGGALAVRGGDEIVGPISRIAGHFTTVVATQDWHPRGHISFASRHGKQSFSKLALYGGEQAMWPDHCVQGTPGAALHHGLDLAHVSVILRKGARCDVDSYSAFFENVGPDGKRPSTGLADLLRARGIGRVFVCGLARDVCVADTALDAAAEGFDVTLIDDLTRAVDEGSRVRVDTRLKSAGVKIENAEVLS
ncbi:MAG: bifunctional nicotinamidase/pyrazinamidase [Polyangia bacterium]